jgi:enoyl-CoA hydratase/carnithine racemase
MSTFEEYSKRYQNIHMSREDGILTVTLQTNGAPFEWGLVANEELCDAFNEIGNDLDNMVMILTGTGDVFLGKVTGTMPNWSPEDWERIERVSRRRLRNLLDIDIPIISAVNGPVRIHVELPLLSDIVLAAEEASFQDIGHFVAGNVPGDGSDVVMLHLLGANRGRYYLLTGQRFTARQAIDLGLVSEVMPRDQLMPRARELAKQLLAVRPLTLRSTRRIITEPLKRLIQDRLPYGMALEGLAAVDKAAANRAAKGPAEAGARIDHEGG